MSPRSRKKSYLSDFLLYAVSEYGTMTTLTERQLPLDGRSGLELRDQGIASLERHHPQVGDSRLSERFWCKMRVNHETGCWEWTAGLFTTGYGQFRIHGTNKPAQRMAWELTYGSIPEGMLVCHHCDNPICVRPDHLFVGTQQDNIADAVKKGRMATGERNPMAKLTWKRVDKIRELSESGVSSRALAAKFAVNKSQVHNIVRYRSWKLESRPIL